MKEVGFDDFCKLPPGVLYFPVSEPGQLAVKGDAVGDPGAGGRPVDFFQTHLLPGYLHHRSASERWCLDGTPERWDDFAPDSRFVAYEASDLELLRKLVAGAIPPDAGTPK